MEKAKTAHSTPPPASPIISGATATAIAETIARLRQIAAHAQDRLYLSDDPPHPDHALLDACAEALRIMREEQDLRERANVLYSGLAQQLNADQSKRLAILRDIKQQQLYLKGARRSALRLIRKQKAVTPAGIYAKALVCRYSVTGVASVAMTLAEDLVNTPSLRASIWPSEGGAA